MNRLKKLVSIFIIFSMLTSSIGVYAADKEKTDCQAVTVFKGLEILDDSFDADAYMTRAGFLKLVLDAMKGSLQLTADVPYSDVGKDSPYYAAISTGYALGIISKAEKFLPDENITYEQAVKILVSILGGDPIAEVSGGYEIGYIKTAEDMKLFEGLSYRRDASVSGSEGVTMIRNAFESYYYYIEDSSVNVKYRKSDKIYMSKFLDIYKNRGLVTSDGFIDFDDTEPSEDNIKIDGIAYCPGKSDIRSYLGQEIIYYYRQSEDDSCGTVLYAEAVSGCEVYDISGDDIREQTTTSKIVYDSDNKTKTLSIAADAKVIYNGKSEFAYTRDMLMPKVGRLRLIDKDSDKMIDTVISYDYSIGVVEAYNNGMNKIVLKFNSNPILIDDYSSVCIEKNGESISLSQLEEWDVLNMYTCDKRLVAAVSDDHASGFIKSVEDGGKSIVIDGESYDISKGYIDASGELKAGERGIFGMDILGNIVFVNYSTTSRRNYNVLLYAGIDSDDDTTWFKLLLQDNKVESVKGAKKIKVDGKVFKSEDAVEAAKKGLHTVVVTDFNESGELVEIDFAEDKTQDLNYKGYDDDNFTLDKDIDSVRFYHNVGAGCHIQSGVVIFSIPSDRTETSLYKAEGYKRVYDMDTTINNIKYYDLDRFNRPGCVVIEDYDLDTPPGQENVDLQDEIFIVSDIYETINEDDEIRTKLCGWHKDSYEEYWIAEEGAHNVSNFMVQDGTTRMENPVPKNDRTMWGFIGHQYTQINKGDIMQLGYNTKGDVAYYRMLWSSELRGTEINVTSSGQWGGDIPFVGPGELYEINENPGSIADPGYMSIGYTSYGEIVSVQDSWFRYKTVLPQFDSGIVNKYNVERSIKNESSIYIIELGAGRGNVVTKGSESDLTVGDKCFVHARDNTCWYMAVIRGE